MAPYPLAIGAALRPSDSQLPSASILDASLALVSSTPLPTHRQVHDLPARPFNHLNLFAYLAIGFIILCYHISKGRMDTNLVPSFTPSPTRNVSAEVGDENVFGNGDGDGGKVYTVFQPRGVSGGIGAIARMGGRVAEVGEKARRTSAKFGQNVVLEMKGLSSCGRPAVNSDSLHNIASRPNNSQATLSDAGTETSSGESDAYYLTSPPMAHAMSGTSAAYVLPFHLPPPPPSPTPAHKQHVERQNRGQQSPVSPSPSFCTIACSPPPITPRLKSPADDMAEKSATWSGQTMFGSEHSQQDIGKDKLEGNPATPVDDSNGPDSNEKGKGSSVQFDSNNIRFASPLNPFAAPAGSSIWSDPKLSPVNGSIVAGAIPMPTSPAPDISFNEESSFVKTITSALKTPPSSKIKGFASPTRLDSDRRDYSIKENGSPRRSRKDTLKATDRPTTMSALTKPNSRPA
ncbi:hypothetical protein CPB84DRAFT_1745374 [Gymnopilus junonius]|uniref:Uncharacterized protein n=1 Tax=Gymnopilus junonius TaxID=109634 RepID=A0A9P5NVE6_GYMJU|nr:hypothetical protein CPB84DRAFT_1745374 [Gymnopilus junonius]